MSALPPEYAILTNPASVAANRAGFVSDAQRMTLERTMSPRAAIGIVVILLMIGGGCIVPVVSSLGLLPGGQSDQFNPISASLLACLGLGLFALAIWAPVSLRRQHQRMRADLAVGIVACADGDVVYSGRGYEMRLDRRPLATTPVMGPLERPLPPRRVNLPPGRYRFYYLPGTKTLLSAEPLTAGAVAPASELAWASTPPPLDPLAGLPSYKPAAVLHPYAQQPSPIILDSAQLAALQAVLAQGNRFTLDELAANREGRLKGRQALRVAARSLLLAPVGMVFLAVLVGMLHGGLIQDLPEPTGILSELTLATAAMVPLAYSLLRVADALLMRAVSMAGVVRGDVDTSDDSTTYRYVIGKQRFRVSPHAYQALVSGMAYRVYYTPLSKTLVSIEPLGHEPR